MWQPRYFLVGSKSNPHSYPRAFWVTLWILFLFFVCYVASHKSYDMWHMSRVKIFNLHDTAGKVCIKIFEMLPFSPLWFRGAASLLTVSKRQCCGSFEVPSFSKSQSCGVLRFCLQVRLQLDGIWAEDCPVVIQNLACGTPGRIRQRTSFCFSSWCHAVSAVPLCLIFERRADSLFFGPVWLWFLILSKQKCQEPDNSSNESD